MILSKGVESSYGYFYQKRKKEERKRLSTVIKRLWGHSFISQDKKKIMHVRVE